MNGGEEEESLLAREYKELLDRFERLECSHVKLQEQINVLLQEKKSEERKMRSDSADMTSYPGWGHVPGAYFAGSPYKNVFDHMGHALHVTRIASGDIIFWNRAAEKLYDYKEHEVLGRKEIDILFTEEYHPSALRMTETVKNGRSWSGQLPLKKKSGKVFMALVTKSPMYEDGELVCIITNSQDGTVFNSTNSANNRHGGTRTNLDKIKWSSRPQIAAVPHFARSVSSLASKVLSRKHGETEPENEDVKADGPPVMPTTKPVLGVFMEKNRTYATSSDREVFHTQLNHTLDQVSSQQLRNADENLFSYTGVSIQENFAYNLDALMLDS